MRVLILAAHKSAALGGIEIQCDLIAQELVRLGHTVVYCAAGGATGDYAYELDVWQPMVAGSVIRLIERHRPDVVYVRHNKRQLRRTVRESHRAGVPVVFAVSSRQDAQRWAYHRSRARLGPRRLLSIAWQRIKSRWNWIGVAAADGLTVLNPDFLSSLPAVPKAHIPDSMVSDGEPFNWPRPFIAWVAQLKDYKHPEAFVELARRCGNLDIDFLMVGGLVNSGYESIASHRGTPPRFRYLGPMTPEQVNGFLAASEFLVHTCEPEGFGNNFIQAWQQGKPTLSLQFDPAGVIERERIGEVPGNMVGLERAVRKLLSQPALCAEMGARAKVHADAHHDPSVNVAKLADFLRAVIDGFRA